MYFFIPQRNRQREKKQFFIPEKKLQSKKNEKKHEEKLLEGMGMDKTKNCEQRTEDEQVLKIP